MSLGQRPHVRRLQSAAGGTRPDLDLLVDAVIPLLRQARPVRARLRAARHLRDHLGLHARAQPVRGRTGAAVSHGKCISACSSIPPAIISPAGGIPQWMPAASPASTTTASRADRRARQVRPVLRGRHAGGAREGRPRDREGGLNNIDSISITSALSAVTECLGLVATLSTTYNEPYYIAERFASLDHISNGRAGWNIITTANDDAAYNFGQKTHMEKPFATSARRSSSISAPRCGTAGTTMRWSPIRARHVRRSRTSTRSTTGPFFSVKGALDCRVRRRAGRCWCRPAVRRRASSSPPWWRRRSSPRRASSTKPAPTGTRYGAHAEIWPLIRTR